MRHTDFFKKGLIAFYLLMTTVAVNAATIPNPSDSAKDVIRIGEIQRRVNEIQDMNFSELSRGEKHQLKQELKQLKNETELLGQQRESRNGGIYLSVGAIIIIILLLIILL